MRQEMVEELIKEVRGPRKGSLEEIDFDPWQEYMCGVVIPYKWKTNDEKSPDDPDSEQIREDENVYDEDNADQDEINATTLSELDPRYQIKSFGISFIVDSPSPKFEICTTWGRYTQINKNTEIVIDDEDYEETWIRKSYGDITTIKLNKKDNNTRINLNNIEEDGDIYLHIKKISLSETKSHISVYLVNDLNLIQDKDDYHPKTEFCLFQPSIRVKFDSEYSLLNIDPISANDDELKFLYRNKPVKASGHMCSAVWDDIEFYKEFNEELIWPDYTIQIENNSNFEKFLNCDVRSEFIPLYPMPLSSFDISDENIKLEADKLSESYLEKDLEETLMPLLTAYSSWIEENQIKSSSDEFKKSEKIIKKIIDNEKTAYSRMLNGLKILKDNPFARLSFCFANKTISMQNSWSGRSNFIWRPYQIAFFLMNIDSIVNKDSDEKNILDLLWIPTGGGKTEAYLAIIAFTIAFRRLISYENGDSTGSGVSVISRYTLRLLTVQQFRRTLKLVTAAEFLRVFKNNDGSIGWRPENCNITGDWIYGSVRYSAGMWVGGGVSPLRLLDNEFGAISSLKDDNKNDASQLLKCPVCGSWLSIPDNGIPADENEIHIVLKPLKDINIDEKFNDLKNHFRKIEDINITFDNHLNNNFTLSIKFNSEMSKNELGNIFDYIELDFKFISLNKYKLGYFNSLSEIKGKKKKGEFDFEIWCTNPHCDLNNITWKEGTPFDENKSFKFPDGNYEHHIESPFIQNTRMPIPGYTIDEHVYYRCPTVIISTADKIARLAFEPRASALFGNINKYNKYYGYYRDDLLPKTSNKGSWEEYVNVEPFKTPDLIIQDELHLMDGPLGSLFGLYETMVEAIIKKQGGNPKYIASTATINNANKQSKYLFSKELSQFPPSGLDIDDSFFVKGGTFKDGFDEEKPGRLYLGIYAPGKGPMTPQVRLWGRILKTSKDHEDNSLISQYWTLVGYFNSIRELGGGRALYRDDINIRVNNITKDEFDGELDKNKTDDENYNIRKLDSDNVIELSSRIDSTELSIILDSLERDGKNGKKPNYDAIFTTSMFGTGVDIGHLSLMIMTSQPKTTGDYIQATGRIGRNKGGLIVTFFKSGRPRDLNHYELFSSYHSRIHLDVEPVSVSPFSKGALEKGLGPAIVAFLRNANNLNIDWTQDDAKIINDKKSDEDLKFIEEFLINRLKECEIKTADIEKIRDIFKSNIDKWKYLAKLDNELHFNEYNPFHKLKYNVVLGDLEHGGDEDLDVVYENAPQSLREIEETIGFWV